MTKKPAKPSLKIVGQSTPTGVQPPRKLGEPGSSLWDVVMSEYQIDDCGGIEILCQICTMLDRAEEMAAQINSDGCMTSSQRPDQRAPAAEGRAGLSGLHHQKSATLGLEHRGDQARRQTFRKLESHSRARG